MYDLKSLKVFASVMRHGSLSASSRELSLPKSTLSRRLQQLEAQVGQPLLHRDGNRMAPTEAGRVLAGYCSSILSLAEESREALGELQQDVSGELSLRVHGALIRGWFAPKVEEFLALHPNIRITLRTQLDVPDPGERDVLCLWLGPLPEGVALRQETLGRLTRGLYAHPNYLARKGTPRHPRELARHQWVDLLGDGGDHVTLQHVKHGRFPVPLPGSRIRVDQMVLQGDAIAAGHGLGLLPHWIVEKRLRHHPGSLVACMPEWHAPPLSVRLLMPHGQLPRRSQAFIEFLRASVPDAWKALTPGRLDQMGGTTASEGVRPVCGGTVQPLSERKAERSQHHCGRDCKCEAIAI